MTETGLRERQKQARREALVDAAQALAGAGGPEAVTVEDICARAGVSVRTFHNYFETKDDAVLGVAPWRLDDAARDAFVAGGPTGRLPDDLGVLVGALASGASMGPQRLACAMDLLKKDPRLLGRHVAVFERRREELGGLLAQRLHQPVDSPRVELLTLITLALVRATFLQWEAGGRDGDVADAVPPVLATLRELLAD